MCVHVWGACYNAPTALAEVHSHSGPIKAQICGCLSVCDCVCLSVRSLQGAPHPQYSAHAR